MNNMSKFAAITIGLLASATAGTVSSTNIVGGAGDLLIANTDGSIATSGIAAAGYFNSTFDVSAALASNNYASLLQNFNVLASATIGNTQAALDTNVAGYYAIGDTDYGAPAARTGSVIYTFFGNGATLSDSTSIGLARSVLTIDAETFPPDSNAVTVSTSSADGSVLLGTIKTTTADLGPLGDGTPGQVSTLGLVPIVPEPSVALLGVLGLAGLVRRRR